MTTDLLPIAAALALKASVVLGVAALAERTVLRRASAAARHLAWTLALAATLLLPLLGLALPRWDVAVRAAPAVVATVDAATSAPMSAVAPATRAVAPDVVPEPARVDALAASPATATPAHTVPWTSLLVGAYLVGVALLLLRVVVEQLAARALVRRAAPVRDEAWLALQASLARTLGLRCPVRLLRGDAAAMPMAAGVARPAVVLPAGADAWDADRRRAVLLHELAHVARHDCLTQTLAALACALYWPHPGVWWAAARLRVTRELACDDLVVTGGLRAHDYAAHLLAVAHAFRAPRRAVAGALPMASTSQLETRLRALVDRARPRTAPGRRTTAVATLAVATALLPLSALRAGARAPTAPSVPKSAVVVSAAPVSAVPVSAVPASAASAEQFTGDWHLRLATRDEASSDAPTAHLMLVTRGLTTGLVPFTRIVGLAPETLATGDARVRFEIRREAGTFLCEGSVRGGRGSGRFTFAPAAAYADALERRGMARPSPAQLYSLAQHDVDLAFLDALEAHGYARPSTERLVRAGVSGVDRDYVLAMAALGHRLGTLDALVSLYNSGVTPGFARELAALGYRDLSVRDLVSLQNNGATAGEVRRLNARAGRTLTVRELVTLRARGESAETERDASRASAAAPPTAPATTPVEAQATPLSGRWILANNTRGDLNFELQWTDDTQWRRTATLAEFEGLSDDAMRGMANAPVAFRLAQDAGTFTFEGTAGAGRGTGTFRFAPARGFVATLRGLGVTGLDAVSDHQLKNLAWGGMSAASVRELHAMGYGPLSLDDATHLAIRQVTPAYARALREAGVAGAATDVGDLRLRGLTADYVRELAALGYRGLTAEQLIALRRAGVTPDFVRRVRDAAGGAIPGVDALVELRRAATPPR